MPKAYSKREKEIILNRLKEESKKLFFKYGIKKTTVDEIVKNTNIPKGTFYLFYPSKEMLLFELIMEEQELIQGEILKKVSSFLTGITKEDFSILIFDLYIKSTSSFLFTILTSGEYELLLRKLPKEAIEGNINEDDLNIKKLFSLLPNGEKKDIKAYSAAFRGIMLLSLHKEEMGKDVFDNALKIIIDSLALKLFSEE